MMLLLVACSKYTGVQTDPCKLLARGEAEQMLGPLSHEPSSSQGNSMFRNCFFVTGKDELSDNSILLGVAEFSTEAHADEAFEDWSEFDRVTVDSEGTVTNLGRRAIYRVARSNQDFNTAPHDTVEFYIVKGKFLIRLNVNTFDRSVDVASVRSLADQVLNRLP